MNSPRANVCRKAARSHVPLRGSTLRPGAICTTETCPRPAQAMARYPPTSAGVQYRFSLPTIAGGRVPCACDSLEIDTFMAPAVARIDGTLSPLASVRAAMHWRTAVITAAILAPPFSDALSTIRTAFLHHDNSCKLYSTVSGRASRSCRNLWLHRGANMDRTASGLLNGLLGVIIFSGSLPATRAAVTAFDPVFLTAARAAIAGLLGLGLLLAFKEQRPARSDILPLTVVALGVVVGFPLLTAMALRHVTSAHSIVFIGLLPLATAIFGVVRGGERPRPAFWLFSCLGSALVVGFALSQGMSASRRFCLCRVPRWTCSAGTPATLYW
jgi:hypothetical protein